MHIGQLRGQAEPALDGAECVTAPAAAYHGRTKEAIQPQNYPNRGARLRLRRHCSITGLQSLPPKRHMNERWRRVPSDPEAGKTAAI